MLDVCDDADQRKKRSHLKKGVGQVSVTEEVNPG